MLSFLVHMLRPQGQDISVVKLNKSGGVVKREREERRVARDNRIREYFFGTPSNPLQPTTQIVRSDQLKVFRIGKGLAGYVLYLCVVHPCRIEPMCLRLAWQTSSHVGNEH
jgi:polyribonucleotide 5'-hydroxyl-kinase